MKSEHDLPEIEKINSHNEENIIRQLKNVNEFLLIKKELDNVGVKAIPFKGFALAHDFYDNIGVRESYDIDIFIDKKDLESVKAVMAKCNYEVRDIFKPETDKYTLDRFADCWFNKWSEGKSQFYIEYHWKAAPANYRMDIHMQELEADIINTKFSGTDCEVFNPEASFLLAIMHHGGKEQYFKLRHILDIGHFLRKYPDADWNKILEKATRLHLEKMVYLGIGLASEITGIPIPEPLKTKVQSKSIKRMIPGRLKRISMSTDKWYSRKDILSGWIFNIRSRDGFKAKLQLAWYTFLFVFVVQFIPERLKHKLAFNNTIVKITAFIGI